MSRHLSSLTPIWRKAEVRNGDPDQCRCTCQITCKPRCIVSSGDDLLRCLTGHLVVDCGHKFDAEGKCKCGVTALGHQILCGF